MNNVRSQREIHLGVSSFRVFFLFCFFFFRGERERASDDTESLFLSPFGRRERFFETDFGEKKDFKEKRSSVGSSLCTTKSLVVGRERESKKKRDFYSARRAVYLNVFFV